MICYAKQVSTRSLLLPVLGILALTAAVAGGCWQREASWQAIDGERASVARPGESEAQRLYRLGRDCMDTLERDDCATDYFEQLIERGSPRRELIGDATFRLVELYRRHGREEQATLLLRRFWELGMDSGGAGLVPYGARFAPAQISNLFVVDVARLEASRLHQELPQDARDYMFTCDEARRDQLREAAEQRRSERRAEKLAAMSEAERRDYDKREARMRRGPPESDGPAPIYAEHMCTAAAALGLADSRDFTLFLGASDHRNAEVSLLQAGVEDLDARLATAVEAGRLRLEDTPKLPGRDLTAMTPGQRERLRVWTLVGAEYAGAPVQLLSLDRDELTVAPAALVPGMLEARAGEQTRLGPELQALLDQVPPDVAFATVVTPEAMGDFLDEAGAMAKLLPNPDGLLMAAVVYDYAALFIRVPTEDSVKAWLVLSIARRMLDGMQSGEDDDFLTNLDISQTPDGRALLMSNILSRRTITLALLGG